MKLSDVPSCGFTNAQANRLQKVIQSGICVGTASCDVTKAKATYVGCMNCKSGHTTIWRCTNCYRNLQKFIPKQNIVSIPILEFFSIDFDNLDEERIESYCKRYPNYITKSNATWKQNCCVLVFKNGCPCCYKFVLPSIIQPMLSSSDCPHRGLYGTTMVQSITEIQMSDVYHIQDSAVKKHDRTLTIGVVLLEPVVPIDRQNEFLHHIITEKNQTSFTDVEYLVRQFFGKRYEKFDVLIVLGELETQ